MLYEKFFETKTKGIIQGSSVLFSELPNGSSNIYDPHPARGCPWNHKELFFDETLKDTRKKPTNITACGSFINWKIVIKSRETGETIWVRPFLSKSEAFIVWARLINLDLERVEQNGGMEYCPTTFYEGDLVYEFATVESFTSTGTTSWSVPSSRVRSVQYVIVAGGGSGSRDSQFCGAGGAGGYRSSVTGESSGGGASAETAVSVSYGSSYPITVGSGGSPNFAGNSSAFSGYTTVGGGRGGGQAPTYPNTGGSGGSGGGGHEDGGGGSGTPGQGYSGSQGQPNDAGGGGGGAAQAGATGASGAAGGNGVASSITGSSVYRAGGGGGGKRNTQPAGGNGGGGYGSRQSPGSNAANGSPNTGGGGGGGGGSYNAGSGGSGIVILSYTPVQNVQINLPMLGM